MLGACLEHAWSIALRLIDLRTDLSRLGQRTALHCRRDPLPGKSTAAKHPNPFMPGWLDAEPVPRRPSAGSVGVTPNDDAHPEHMRFASHDQRPAEARVLLPAWWHLIIVLAAAPTRIASLGIPIGLEKRPVAPEVAARNGDISRRPARHKAALGLVVQHRDELGAMVGLAAQRLVRDDDRGSRHCGRRDAIEHI